MRLAPKTDHNQRVIVNAYRQFNCSVAITAPLGKGFPDLVVGIPTVGGGVNELVEVKDGAKPPSARRLTTDETRFFEDWRGRAPRIIETVDDVIAHVTAVKNEAKKNALPD